MCSLCPLLVAKSHNFGQILTFWGSCTDPLLPVCYSRPTVYAYVPNLVSIGLFCRSLLAKNPNFAVFWTSAFSGVASWQQSENVQQRCTTTTFPYPTASKLFLYSNLFMVKSGAQPITFKSVTNKETDRQKNSTLFCRHGGG